MTEKDLEIQNLRRVNEKLQERLEAARQELQQMGEAIKALEAENDRLFKESLERRPE